DVANNPTQPHKAGKKQDDDYVEPEDACPPPEQVSKKTLMKRLDRICTQKADGTYKVPMEIISSYKNLESREQVYRAFEKCGCEPDPLALFTKRMNRKYEEINEKSVETEFEFLTEEEMEGKGWSESLRLIIKGFGL
ncbi:unnamed protein product, partial [Symbiodinium necroappetens]